MIIPNIIPKIKNVTTTQLVFSIISSLETELRAPQWVQSPKHSAGRQGKIRRFPWHVHHLGHRAGHAADGILQLWAALEDEGIQKATPGVFQKRFWTPRTPALRW